MKKVIAIYLIMAFIFNFIWEMGQIALYKPHSNGVLDLIFVHIRATIGDVIIFLLIYILVSLISRETRWILDDKKERLMLVSVLGFIFAVALEKYALSVGRWGYSELMPIVPFFEVGLSPVLQLMLIAPLSLFLAKMFISKSNKKRSNV